MGTDTDTRALWEQVDALTKPSARRIDRETDAETLAAFTDPTNGFCRVEDYRALVGSHGVIPSLWEQAELALETGRESAGGTGSSPLAQRSPADLDLMEQMLTIRETMPYQLAGRGLIPRSTIPGQIRQLAAHIVSHEPQHVDWWAYRFGQWVRLLGTYLRAIDNGPRPVRLRNAPCPECGATSVTVDTDQGPVVTGPILVDFVNGWIRAATCTACGYTKWRGQDLWDLAEQLANAPRKLSDPDGRISA